MLILPVMWQPVCLQVDVKPNLKRNNITVNHIYVIRHAKRYLPTAFVKLFMTSLKILI